MSERGSRSKRQRTSDVDYREKKRSKREETSSPDAGADTPPQNSVQKECRKIYHDIKELKDPEDGHLCCELFLQPPPRRQYPDYYELIKNPIALNNIKTKIDKMQYTTVDEFKSDVELMVSNAKKYNVKESYAYQDAIKIQASHKCIRHLEIANADLSFSGEQKLLKGKQIGTKSSKGDNEAVQTLAESASKSATIKLPALAFGNKQAAAAPAPPPDSKIKSIRLKTIVKPAKPLHTINELMNAITEKNTKLALEILEVEPSIDVNELVSVDMFNETFTWSALHAAAYYGETKVIKALMAKDANVDIHDTWYSGTPLAWAAFGDRDKAARILVEKYHANKKAKNLHGQIPLDLVSDRDDPRWAGVLTSGPTAPAKPESTVPESIKSETQPIIRISSEATSSPAPAPAPAPAPIIRHDIPPQVPYTLTPEGQTDPIGLVRDVLKNVRNHTDQYGRLYSEIFEDLPDRLAYPEYYKFIRSPLSLQIVEERLASGFYPTLQALETDITQIFQNAMAFAENSSRVHKDAKLLHRLYFRMKERYLQKMGVGPAEERKMMIRPLPPWHGEPIPPRPNVKTSQLDKSTVDAAFGTANMRSTIKGRRYGDSDLDTYSASAPAPPPSVFGPPRPSLSAMQMTTPPSSMPSYSDMPYGIPQYNKPAPTTTFRAPLQFTPPAAPVLPIEAPVLHPAQQAALPFSSPTLPVQQLQQMQAQQTALDPDVARLFEDSEGRKSVRMLNALEVASEDKTFTKHMDGQYFAHSILIGPHVQTLRIKIDLSPPLKQQMGRIVVQAAYNHRRLQPTDNASEWIATPLAHGLNVVSVTITIDVTPSSSPVAAQDMEAQTYVLFITRNPV